MEMMWKWITEAMRYLCFNKTLDLFFFSCSLKIYATSVKSEEVHITVFELGFYC